MESQLGNLWYLASTLMSKLLVLFPYYWDGNRGPAMVSEPSKNVASECEAESVTEI